MKKTNEMEIVNKALEIWATTRKFDHKGKKLNKAELTKLMNAYQKLVMLEPQNVGRAYDVAYYFYNNVFNTTELTAETVKKYNKLFDKIKDFEYQYIDCYDFNFKLQKQNLKTVREAGIKFNIYFLD